MVSKMRFALIGMVLFVLLTAACAPKAVPHPPTITPAQPAAQPVEGQGGEPTPETTAVEPTPTAKGGVPADVPIMDGAYKLQVMRSGTTIIYQVDVSIDVAVKFYQDAFPRHGWETAGSPDTAVGQIATLLRKNAQDDRLTVNMQGNDVGGFVKITISIGRKE